ncbi:hypothetical protein CHUAL_008190 [Chamberlinius hualienensis]
MADLTNLTLDLDELQKLLNQAERTAVKEILLTQIRKYKNDIAILQNKEAKLDNKPPTTGAGDRSYAVKLSNYAWDQSDKFVKLYITLNKVQTLPAENVKCEFSNKSMDLSINGLEKRNYSLILSDLLEQIVVDGSHFKVKTDMIVVFMKKEKSTNWSHLTLRDKKAKEPKAPKMGEDADPSKGLMEMMKQMYDDGDDDMKRTIAKAWTESRNKSPEYDLGGGV